MPTDSMRPPGTVVVPSGSTIDTASPGFTRYSWETSRSTVTMGVVLVAVSTVPPPACRPKRRPKGVTDVTRMGPGSKTIWPSEDLAGRRQAERALPAFDRRGRGRGVVGALGQPGAVAEGDQVVGQLAHVGAVGHADVERPVGGDGAVEERHRLVADRVDGLVLPDDLARLGQRGVDAAAQSSDGVGAVVADGAADLYRISEGGPHHPRGGGLAAVAGRRGHAVAVAPGRHGYPARYQPPDQGAGEGGDDHDPPGRELSHWCPTRSWCPARRCRPAR